MSAVAQPALAQDQKPSDTDIANARALATEGIEAADRGDCTTAIDRLWRAESLYHAPTILERLGECQIALGKIVAGTESLQRLLREPVDKKAPPAFVAARDRAQKVLDAALPKIGKLRIHVDNAQAPGLVVRLDGESVPVAGLDVDRLADPGTHQIDASAPGYLGVMTTVSLPEGGATTANLKLVPETAAPPAAGAAPAPAQPATAAAATPAWSAGPAAPPAKDDGGGPSRVGPIVLMAGGGAALIVGGIFGGMALGKKSNLDSACKPKSDCPPNQQSNIDSLNTDATIATVGFIVGGVAAAAGGVWFFTQKSPEPAKTGMVTVHPWVGPTSAGLSGAF